ncbi:MAG: 50S ribosomal protein L13 [Candidatus Uhrbacteria bacterium]
MTKANFPIQRSTHKLDASGQTLGRFASQIAILLRGKHKPTFTPHIDNGDIVYVANLSALRFTEKKAIQKRYYHYSGYPGGMKHRTLRDQWAIAPAKVLGDAVYGMLPSNRLRAHMIKRLRIEK